MRTDNQNLTEISKTPKRWHRIPCAANWAQGWTNICQKPQLKSIRLGVNWRAQARAWHEHGYITACVGGQRWLEVWGRAPVPSQTVSHGKCPGAYLTRAGDAGPLLTNGTLNVSLTAATSAWSIDHFLVGRSVSAAEWLITRTWSDLKDYRGLSCYFNQWSDITNVEGDCWWVWQVCWSLSNKESQF